MNKQAVPVAGLTLGFREILTTLFRRKWTIGLVFCAIVILAAAITISLPEVYRSETKLLVKLGRESLVVDPAVSIGGPRTGGAATNLNNQVRTQLEILTSEYLASEVIEAVGVRRFLEHPQEAPSASVAQEDVRVMRRTITAGTEAYKDILAKLDLTSSESERNQAIRMFMSNLNARVAPESSIITATYEAESPDLAQDALATLTDLCVDHSIKVNAFQASPEFFDSRVTDANDRLEEAEIRLRQFRESNQLMEDSAAQQATLNEEVTGLRTAIRAAEGEAENARARIMVLEEAVKARKPTTELSRTVGAANTTVETLKAERMTLQSELRELAALYPESHRLVVSAKEKLANVELALSTEPETRTVVTTGADPHYETFRYELDEEKANLQAALARMEMLATALDRCTAELDALIGSAAAAAQMQREVDFLKQEYVDYRETLHRTRINQALDRDKVSGLSVVQPATRPVSPIRPNKILGLMMGVLLGGGAGITVAFTRDLLDNTLKTGQEVERRLGLPVLTSVSEEEFRTCA